ncbi:hypothetical protein ABK040_006105 [Willaertia magna]
MAGDTNAASSMTSNNANGTSDNEELWKELIQQLFTIASGEQLISVINVSQINIDKKKGKVTENKILCLTTKKKMISTSKKKKGYKVRILSIKKKDGCFHIEKQFKLKRLSKIEGSEDNVKEITLNFSNEKRGFKVICESKEQLNIFISKILQLMRENFRNEPILENINLIELSEYLTVDEEDELLNEEDNLFSNEEIGDIMSQRDLITEEEEKIMKKVIEQFNQDISDAKLVASELSQRLAIYERENIHTILQKQEQWELVISQLESAEVQLVDMNDWLERYNKKLMLMQKDIVQIESENNNMEVQARNLKRLSDELDNLINKLEFDDSYIQSILNDPFDGKLNKINDAVDKLQKSLNDKLQDGMDEMIAVKERNKYFQILRFNLVNRFKVYLKKFISKLSVNILKQRGKNFKFTIETSLNYNSFNKEIIQLHKDAIHKDLSKYNTLMECVRSTQEAIKDVELFEMLKLKSKEMNKSFILHLKKDKMLDRPMEMLQNIYSDNLQTPYRKEIHEFILDVKQTIKSNKENKEKKTFLLGTKSSQLNEKAITKRTSTKLKVSPHLLNNNNSSNRNSIMVDDDEQTEIGTEIDFSDDETELDDEVIEYVRQGQSTLSNRVDTLFAYCLNTVCNVMYHEQMYITKFFLLEESNNTLAINDQQDSDEDNTDNTADHHINRASISSVNSATSGSLVTTMPTITNTKSELFIMLEKLFKGVNEDFEALVQYIKKHTDRFYSLSMSLAIEKQYRLFNSKSNYISEFIIYCKTLVQQVIHKFITKQINSINEFKCNIKKIHVVPFIVKFSYFNDRFETILANFSDLSTTGAATDYLKIIKAMFETIEKLAQTDEKHSSSFRMKNYSYFYHSINKRPNLSQNPDIQKQVEISKKRFEDACRFYIVWMINWKFEHLFKFIEGMEDCLKTCSKEDIIYQTQFSKSKVKELIKRYDEHEIQKGIHELMKRMDKHIGQKNVDESSYKIPKSIEERGPKVLHKEIWSRLRKYFVTKYERLESIVNECYTNCKLYPSRDLENIFDNEEKQYKLV